MKRDRQALHEARTESLSPEGRGVARVDGKVVFIEGALADERVQFRYRRRRGSYDEAQTVAVLQPSAQRIAPKCPHFGLCGGCSLQHLSAQSQIAHKQQVLVEQLRTLGGLQPKQVLPPITGATWGYRHKARLAVKHVPGKGGALVGFRERNKPFVADISSCDVLHPLVGSKLLQLRALVNALSCPNRIPQIEVAVGDDETALVIRHLVALTDADHAQLQAFAERNSVRIFLQPGGPETVRSLSGDAPLYYRLSAHKIDIGFQPTDFIQVNAELNRKLVDKVVELLDPQATDAVIDLFCGVGNFTLPLARRAAQVTGVDVGADLIRRARENTKRNEIKNVDWICADLAEPQGRYLGMRFQRILLDPPRTGAYAVLERMDLSEVERLVYVSCNPATLGRDARLLSQRCGFTAARAGIVDMFPHTSHVESIVVFEPPDQRRKASTFE